MKILVLVVSYGLLIAGLAGCATSGVPEVIVRHYDYRVKPPETPYESTFDDPSLVVFKSQTYRRIRIEINGQTPITIEAYDASPNIHLRIGDYPVRVIIEKPTAVHGTWQVIQFFTIHIRPEGRAQIFHICDPSDYYGRF